MSTNVHSRLRPSWRHLREPALASAALQMLNGEVPALKPSEQAHLIGCERCAARLEELREVLAGERHAAVDAADALFSDARLTEQRRGILDRLEARQRGARVLHFPTLAPSSTSRRERPAMRWMAAAAAAGLTVGIAIGPLVMRDAPRFPHASIAAARRAAGNGNWWISTVSHTTAQPSQIAPETDELFLSEMETALAKRRIPALRALDDLTPRTHDLVSSRRRR